MTNPLVQMSDLLDEAAAIFVSKAFSEQYDAPAVYLLQGLEAEASKTPSFSESDYEKSLEILRDKINERLGQGHW